MNFVNFGRAMIVAVGFAAGMSGPLQAQDAAQAPDQAAAVGTATDTSAEPARPARRHVRKAAAKPRAERHAAKASKPAPGDAAKADQTKADEIKASDAQATDLTAAKAPGMSAAVANANAQWDTGANPNNTYNMSAQAGTVMSQMGAQHEQPATPAPDDSANAQVVAADQVNELDRAAADDKPPLTLAKATIDAPPAAAATAENNTPWEQTSLIGKLFIAFGGVLTLASAARMFMA